MKTIDLLGILSFLAILVAFYLGRWRMILFNLFSILTICLFLFLTLRFQIGFSNEILILSAGLTLFWFGLLIVRVMLERSVSLRLLAHFANRASAVTLGEDIAGRLEDLIRHKFAVRSNDAYTLTAFGRFTAFLFWLCSGAIKVAK